MTRVQHFYDQVTSTFTYVVSDAEAGVAAIIDPVLDLDYASGTLTTRSADEVIQYIRAHHLSLRYILETTSMLTTSPARLSSESSLVGRS